MLRSTTATAFDQVVDTLQQRQNDLVRTQQQLTSGKRVLHASDDPVAAARAERARSLEQRADATQRAIDASKNSMTLTESALGQAVELMQQARELAVAAGDASYSNAQRRDLARQIAAIRDQLVGIANRSDGSGGYVFSGQGTSQPPFLDGVAGMTYTGRGGQVQVASQEPLPLTLDGQQVWMSAASGNGVFKTSNVNSTTAWIDAGQVSDPAALTTSSYDVRFSVSGGNTTYSIYKDGAPAVTNAAYVSGKSIQIDGMSFSVNGSPANNDQFSITPAQSNQTVFAALDDLVNAIAPSDASKIPSATQVTQAVQAGLRDIDQTMGNLQSARSVAGETLNRIEGATTRVSDLKLFAKTTASNAEDLDETQSISDFQNKQTGYQVALQTYASLQKMSLFQYINS